MTNNNSTATSQKWGICAGRHDMPVCGYIFDEVKDVFDFESIHERIVDFVRVHGDVHEMTLEDGYAHPVGFGRIDVAVTGLTCLTAELVATCAEMRTDLCLYHYNRDNGEYMPQMFRFSRTI